jgi:hypothetical protein
MARTFSVDTRVAPTSLLARVRKAARENGASQPLLVTCCLPFFDNLYRVDQHHYVQGEVISDPEG